MRTVLGFGLIALAASTGSAFAAGGWVQHGPRGRAVFVGGPGVSSPAVRPPQGYLGVDVRDVTNDQLPALKLKEARGAEITLVDHDGPAGKAGLHEHDVVLQMNGQVVQDEEQIRRMLRESPPGRTVTLLISRDGLVMTITAQMANRDDVEKQAWQRHLAVPEPNYPPAQVISGSENEYTSDPAAAPAPTIHAGNSFMGRLLLLNPSYTGAMLEVLNKPLAQFFGASNGAGLLVRSVAPNSPAEVAGLRVGDVVVRANAQVVASTREWTKAIENSHGRPVTVVVLRDKKEQTLTLTPDSKKRSQVEMPSTTAPPAS